MYADTLGRCLEQLLWGYPELLKEFIEKVQPAMKQNEKVIRKQADGTLKNDEDNPRIQSQNGDLDEKAASLDLPGMSSDPLKTRYPRSGSPVSAQEDDQPEDIPFASGTKIGCSESSSPPQIRPLLKLDDTDIAGCSRSDTEKSLQIPETKIGKGKRKATEEMGETE